MFYVYEWFNLKTGDVFYVGKGCNGRYKQSRRRNRLFQEYFENNDCGHRIVKQFSDEQEAFEYEKKRILELKALGQANCNIDDGGHGGLNSVWTVEARENWSKNNPMKEEKQRLRMSRHNPMKNAEVARRVTEKKCEPVVINGIVYDSIRIAAEHFGVRQTTVIKWCRKGVNENFEPCKYLNREQVKFSDTRYNKGGCRALIYKGVRYESPIDLAKEMKLHNSTVAKWAKRGFDPHGNECRYEDDKPEYTFKPFVNGESLRKAIIVNGVEYPSKADAERTLGLCKGYLAPYLAGTRKNQKYICRYVNQQPSRTNTDDSSSEGSTTNR